MSTRVAPPGLACLAVNGLSHAYPGARGPVAALDGVSFSVRTGQFCAVIGPSGCGKTTLLHVLAGLIAPTRGTVTLPPRSPGRLVTAVVFQGISTFPWMTVRQNVAYGLRALGLPAAERRRRVEQQVARVGLADFLDAYPHQLSEGMRQRTGIARAFATDPDVLLMDEPFGSLDEQTRLRLQDELLGLWQGSGKTVVFVTHSLDEAARLADRVLVMSARPGRVTADIAVPFPRPRGYGEVRSDPAYGAFTARLWTELAGSGRPAAT